MNRNQKPLPRFWYFPSGFKAMVIMTGDDHAKNGKGTPGGSAAKFEIYKAASFAGCSGIPLGVRPGSRLRTSRCERKGWCPYCAKHQG